MPMKMSVDSPLRRKSFGARLLTDFRNNWVVYLMLLPVVLYYVIFHYAGIYYSVIAFLDYKPMKGISGSRFVGLKYFEEFLKSIYAWRLIRNTLLINLYQILFAFTA